MTHIWRPWKLFKFQDPKPFHPINLGRPISDEPIPRQKSMEKQSHRVYERIKSK